MAVQAQFGVGFGGYALPFGGLADEQAVMTAFLTKGNNGNGWAYAGGQCPGGVASAAQSELTCNGGSSRKRGASELEHCYASVSSAALLPIPGMATKQHAYAPQQSAFLPQRQSVASSRMADSRMESTSGRTAVPSVTDALVAELCRQGAEVDALVRAECDRMRAGLEQARKRHCQALVTAAASAAARAIRDKEMQIDAARRRAVELEERVRQAAAESQAWCALARSNEAVAAGLRATLDTVLLPAPVEGFGDSDPACSPVRVAAAEDDAQSCCFVARADPAADTAASSRPAGKWGCKACGEREATVLLLPCRHLCLCKACEPRNDSCPVCFAAKSASIHVAAN